MEVNKNPERAKIRRHSRESVVWKQSYQRPVWGAREWLGMATVFPNRKWLSRLFRGQHCTVERAFVERSFWNRGFSSAFLLTKDDYVLMDIVSEVVLRPAVDSDVATIKGLSQKHYRFQRLFQELPDHL